MVPVGDLLGQMVVDSRLGLGDEIQFAGADLGQVLGDHIGNGVHLGRLFQVAPGPRALGPGGQGGDLGLAGLEMPVIQVQR